MNLLKSTIPILLALLSGCSHFANTCSDQNEIWIHDSRLCVVADPVWGIDSHHPFGDFANVSFLLYQDREVSTEERQIWYDSKIRVSTYDLPNEEIVSEFKVLMSRESVLAEDVSIAHFEGWTIFSWDKEYSGAPYRFVDARRMYEEEQVGVFCSLSWPLLKDRSSDYDKRMYDAHEYVLSQIRVVHPQRLNE